MTAKPNPTDRIIRGSCADFVCRQCRTKYGWAHQIWCDRTGLTEPDCTDCAYYSEKQARCSHPANKSKKEAAG